jgi:hypothetical protein
MYLVELLTQHQEHCMLVYIQQHHLIQGGGTEVSGGSYARKSMPAMTVSGTSPTEATNGAAVEFITATGSWGTVTHVGVFDASSSGNLLAWAALTASKTVFKR